MTEMNTKGRKDAPKEVDTKEKKSFFNTEKPEDWNKFQIKLAMIGVASVVLAVIIIAFIG